MAIDLHNSINKIFLDKDIGVWFDYDLQENNLKQNFYPSNIYPLLFSQNNKIQCAKVLDYLNKENVLIYKGVLNYNLKLLLMLFALIIIFRWVTIKS